MIKSRRIGFAIAAIVALLAGGIVYSQTSERDIEGILVFRPDAPQVRSVNPIAFFNRAGTSVQAVSMGMPVVTASSGSTALTIRQSGGLAINTGTTSTTEFVLPLAATSPGANYCFVENGDAGGELLVGVQTADNVVGHGATDTGAGTGVTAIATTAALGVKNTAATNVKGDFACVTSDGITTWVMTSVIGIWATR